MQAALKDETAFYTGAAITCVYSATRVILVKDQHFAEPRWKVPGGSIEGDEPFKTAAARETAEETGIRLEPRRIILVWLEEREASKYKPFRCRAFVTEVELDKHAEYGNENGHDLEVEVFHWREIDKLDILPEHRALLEFCRSLTAH